MHFVFPKYETLADWERRAAWLREHILVVLGLWPMPEKGPLNPRIFGRLDYEDYSIEKVYFESWPGFYCTGNLYRPRGKAGPFPGILNPHGHWQKGRLEHQPLASIRARCITFARMGMVAFSYDMVGYNDSLQVPAHRFVSLRGSLWGFTSLALQTWNSIRAIDFLQSLDDVDPQRIGCTGASGGGTQTFMVTAIEPRIKVAAPVNMISAHMQGGCVCENAPGLRTETYNVEIAALAAPRPMFIVSATGDWTVNTPTVEYPAIRSIYELYGAGDKVATAQVQAEHNYNAESRQYVYRWFARWFLGDERLGIGAERDFIVEPDERMRVFPVGKLPAGTIRGFALEKAFKDGVQRRLDALLPSTSEKLEYLRKVTKTRLMHVLGATWPQPDTIIAEVGEIVQAEAWREQPVALGRKGGNDRVPGTLYLPPGHSPTRMILAVHGTGREGLRDGFGGPGETIRALLDAGFGVLALDLFYIGAIPKEAAARNDHDWFWATFNPPLLGQRVQDILTALAYLSRCEGSTSLALVGLGEGGPWSLLAAALSPLSCAVCVDLQAIPPEWDSVYLGSLYAPLLRAYGDLRVAAALIAPRPLLLGNTAHRFPLTWSRAAYQVVGASGKLSEKPGPLTVRSLLSWL